MQQTLPLPETYLGRTIERAEQGVIIDGHLVQRVTKGDAFTYWICLDKDLTNDEARSLANLADLWHLTQDHEAQRQARR